MKRNHYRYRTLSGVFPIILKAEHEKKYVLQHKGMYKRKRPVMERYRGNLMENRFDLSAAALHILAMAFMLMDHL